MAQQIGEFETSVTNAVISAETNDGRFESFSIGIIKELEGAATILSTSASWDLGRDGVGVGSATGIFVCASLRDDVDAKALSDIQRLVETTRGITKVYFCSSHPLSEHRRTVIENALRAEVDNAFDIVCLGVSQLTQVAFDRDVELVQRHYGPEIKNTLRAVQADPSDESETRGLRLALISSAAEDSRAIRNELYAAGLLDALNDGVPRTLAACTKVFSEALRLQRNIATAAIHPHLQTLQAVGQIAFDGAVYSITGAGREQVRLNEQQAVGSLIGGRQAIRQALEAATGTRFLEDHFNTVWAVFEERMAHYFLSRGDALVNEISELLSPDDGGAAAAQEVRSPLSFLEELATAVARTSSHAQQRDEIAQAVKDLFTDRTSAATDWLVKLSASFIAACALGLEHSSSAALAKLFSRTSLVLDTDVVLSLVGQGEPEHESVSTIVTRWPKLGGKVLIAEPVLEEVAYHAHIAQADFDGVVHRLPGSPEERMHFIENVFVRSFAELVAQHQARVSHWRTYIGQYRGPQPRDWSVCFSTISADYSVGKLPLRSMQQADLEDQVRRYLSADLEARHSGDALRNAKDKARRDAELYAALVSHLRALKATEPGASCLLVSSARRLVNAEHQFQETGEPQLVVSIAGVLSLLALLPEVSLGITAMKSFLFDERRRGFSSELERTLVRMVRSSQQVTMPWAKRGILMRSVRERILQDADRGATNGRADGPIGELEQHALSPSREARTLQILRQALDEIVVDTKVEKENVELKAKVKILEAKLAKQSNPPAKKK